jgi:phage terminase large subunit-like protein
MDSTLTQHAIKSGAAWLASADAQTRDTFLNELSEGELLALPYLFEFWAHPHQLPPEGDWRSWVILGGRGAGKTRAGAEWVRTQVEGARPLTKGRAKRVALVAETLDRARDVMIFGDSGILECSPPDRRPKWEATKKRLIWPNGATATIYSAHDPESLRGPQFDAAWVDELAKWRNAQATWDMLQFALRVGDDPRQCVTTTPRNVGVLKSLLNLDSTVTTHATTYDNAAHLADSFLTEVRARYAGTRLGRQELDGILVDGVDGALWQEPALVGAQINGEPDCDRIVVAIDPPVTGHAGSDECGIIVAGVKMAANPQDWTAYVLADYTVQGTSPLGWITAAIEAYHDYNADRLVAEVNQGGDLIQELLHGQDATVSYRAVRATRGKQTRAEPIAALYEQGRVKHCRGLGTLEDQMVQMIGGGYHGKGSPDRVDALVWALTDLMLDARAKPTAPRLRVV